MKVTDWIKKHRLFMIFCTALLFRLWLSIINYSGDMGNYVAWGKDINLYGTSGFYERDFSFRYNQSAPNYPPITMLSFALLYFLYNLVGPLIWWLNTKISFFPSAIVWFWQEQKFMIWSFLKIPAIIADLFIAYFIYLFAKKIVKKKNSAMPLIAASLILFNPAFFYNSSYWGQIDAMPLAFTMASLYILFYSKKPIISAVLMTMALLAKQTVIVFLPLYALFFLYKNGIRKSVLAAFASLLTVFLFFIPFYKQGNILLFPYVTFWNRIITSFGSDFLTAHAFNFWGLTTGFGHIRDMSIKFLGLSARFWGLATAGTIMILTIYHVWRKKFRITDVILAAFFISLATFLFSTRMHERHMLIVLPFLLLASLNNKIIMGIFLYMSFFHFINLYSGWWSPHFWPIEIIFSSDNVIKLLIVVTISLFFYLFYHYLKSDYAA